MVRACSALSQYSGKTRAGGGVGGEGQHGGGRGKHGAGESGEGGGGWCGRTVEGGRGGSCTLTNAIGNTASAIYPCDPTRMIYIACHWAFLQAVWLSALQAKARTAFVLGCHLWW